jgi:hypothetical protein
MKTNLHFSDNYAFEGKFLDHEGLTAKSKVNSKTFAELSRATRISVINEWLDGNQTDSLFAGIVNFNSCGDDASKTDIENAITVCENENWKIVVTNDSKATAFSTILVPTKPISQLATLSNEQVTHLANILTMISTRYDNLIMASVGLSIEWFSSSNRSDLMHAVISPIVNSAACMFGSQRFMVSDFTPEQTARRLSNLSDIHFRDIF